MSDHGCQLGHEDSCSLPGIYEMGKGAKRPALTGGQLAYGVVVNWAGCVVSLGVGFFLSPFVVYRLGSVAYGIWTIVNSMISYMVLLNLGLRGAVVRFVSRNHARGEHVESSRAISAALWLRL